MKADPEHPDHPPVMPYQPWPERRETPRAVKAMLWGAIVVHALGIPPAIALMWWVFTDEESAFRELLTSGVCCLPAGALLVGGLLFAVAKAGEGR